MLHRARNSPLGKSELTTLTSHTPSTFGFWTALDNQNEAPNLKLIACKLILKSSLLVTYLSLPLTCTMLRLTLLISLLGSLATGLAGSFSIDGELLFRKKTYLGYFFKINTNQDSVLESLGPSEELISLSLCLFITKYWKPSKLNL